jgi:hypothetical protein
MLVLRVAQLRRDEGSILRDGRRMWQATSTATSGSSCGRRSSNTIESRLLHGVHDQLARTHRNADLLEVVIRHQGGRLNGDTLAHKYVFQVR